MVEKTEGWNGSRNRFVAFLDIMGFKDRLQTDGHEKIQNMLQLLNRAIKFVESDTVDSGLRQLVKSTIQNANIPESQIIRHVNFSDSIILISFDESDIPALFIYSFTLYILRVAFENKIPIKGAIAFGKMTVDLNESIYFGEPLINSFELQKQLCLYGVILHHTCEKQWKNPEYFGKNSFIQYSTPLKTGNIKHYLLNWTSIGNVQNNPETIVSQLYNTVSGAPRIYVDNTLEFVREVLKRKQEKKK